MRILMALALVLGACAGDSPSGGGPTNCTKAAYDPCVDEHDCTSGDCFTFAAAGLEVCSQACDATHPCPDQDGVAVECDATTSQCKPAAATACTIKP